MKFSFGYKLFFSSFFASQLCFATSGEDLAKKVPQKTKLTQASSANATTPFSFVPYQYLAQQNKMLPVIDPTTFKGFQLFPQGNYTFTPAIPGTFPTSSLPISGVNSKKRKSEEKSQPPKKKTSNKPTELVIDDEPKKEPEKETDKFLNYLQEAREGKSDSMIEAAKYYLEGKVVTGDKEEAFKWFKEAEAKGNTKAYPFLYALHNSSLPTYKDPYLAMNYSVMVLSCEEVPSLRHHIKEFPLKVLPPKNEIKQDRTDHLKREFLKDVCLDKKLVYKIASTLESTIIEIQSAFTFFFSNDDWKKSFVTDVLEIPDDKKQVITYGQNKEKTPFPVIHYYPELKSYSLNPKGIPLDDKFYEVLYGSKVTQNNLPYILSLYSTEKDFLEKQKSVLLIETELSTKRLSANQELNILSLEEVKSIQNNIKIDKVVLETLENDLKKVNEDYAELMKFGNSVIKFLKDTQDFRNQQFYNAYATKQK